MYIIYQGERVTKTTSQQKQKQKDYKFFEGILIQFSADYFLH